jgi:A/G-specific adenine glycosylase
MFYIIVSVELLSDQQIVQFQEAVWGYYRDEARSNLPWRDPEPDGTFDPYKILVSECMLQQTQVGRVIPKYDDFLTHFPTAAALAQATLGDVLRSWQGLGYNRRAKFLWQAAQAITTSSTFPDTLEALVKLPGIGPNTAGAILAYAFNEPVVFIETNVRTVYIHHFLADRIDLVDDKELRSLVAQTLDKTNAREWYWALMDYGSHLKTTVGNLNKQSKAYTKQSAFHGSRRQVRGAVIRVLREGNAPLGKLEGAIADPRLVSVLGELENEGLVRNDQGIYALD